VKRLLPAPAEPVVPPNIIVPKHILDSLAGTGYENIGKRYYRPSASFWESARIAFDSLNKSKLRSFLTLLGIILATTTLIVVLAFVNGMNLYIANKFSDMGSDGFKIVRIAFIGHWDPKKFLEMDRRNPQIRPEEYEFIRDHAHLLGSIGMESNRVVTISYAGSTMQSVNLDGVTSAIPAINNTEVARGRTPTDTEVRRHISVTFIGEDVNQRFFAGVDPIGKKLSVDGVQYEVIGVAKAKGSVFGQSQDKFVEIPIYSYFKTYGLNLNTHVALSAKADDSTHLQEAQDEVRMLLRAYRHLTPRDDDNFSVFSSETLTNAWQSLTGAIAGMAFGVVSVFLVVGGIVIMNIMLAVVTERTREIGIRKSLGARRSDILNQFLVESAVLSMTGGLIGVIISFLVTIVVSNTTPLPMEMPLSSVALGVGLSAVVGLFFGIYPARQAAKLNPIVALQSD
jgi:putative ABC transport system permease protein